MLEELGLFCPPRSSLIHILIINKSLKAPLITPGLKKSLIIRCKDHQCFFFLTPLSQSRDGSGKWLHISVMIRFCGASLFQSAQGVNNGVFVISLCVACRPYETCDIRLNALDTLPSSGYFNICNLHHSCRTGMIHL